MNNIMETINDHRNKQIYDNMGKTGRFFHFIRFIFRRDGIIGLLKALIIYLKLLWKTHKKN